MTSTVKHVTPEKLWVVRHPQYAAALFVDAPTWYLARERSRCQDPTLAAQIDVQDFVRPEDSFICIPKKRCGHLHSGLPCVRDQRHRGHHFHPHVGWWSSTTLLTGHRPPK